MLIIVLELLRDIDIANQARTVRISNGRWKRWATCEGGKKAKKKKTRVLA